MGDLGITPLDDKLSKVNFKNDISVLKVLHKEDSKSNQIEANE